MYRAFASFFLIAILLTSGCAHTRRHDNPSSASSSQESVDGSSIDRQSARGFSDALVEAIVADRRSDLHLRMEKAFRDAVSENQASRMLEQLYSTYGIPLEAEFKMDEAGFRMYANGERKPMRKFWYAIRTSRYERGSHFLFVEVVPDENGLACATFSIVTFPYGIPPSLR